MAQRVVVINDTQEILELFREVLELEGYEVVLFFVCTARGRRD